MIGIGIGVNKALSNRKMIGGLVSIADYTNKVAGSTVENPHISKWQYSSSLLTIQTGSSEASTIYYSQFSALDGTNFRMSNSTSGNMSQNLFSFNLIRHIEDRFKAKIPGATVTEKVQWIKDNVAKITANWWGFGSSPSGNKAYFKSNYNDGNWYFTSNHSSNNIAPLNISLNTSSYVQGYVKSDGFVHFLAYADPSDGVTASMLNTDYINLEIEYKNGAYVL